MVRFEYPYWDLKNALDVAKGVHRAGGSAKRQTIADALQMKENSGAFMSKVAAAKTFGLISGKGIISLTAIAKKILQPVPPETPSQGLQEAFLSAPLYKRLYEKFLGVGNSLPDQQTLQHLATREFGVPQKTAGKIVSAFLKSVDFSGISGKEPVNHDIEPQAVPYQAIPSTAYFKMSLTGFGESSIPIETEADWTAAELLFNSLKAKWKKRIGSGQ